MAQNQMLNVERCLSAITQLLQQEVRTRQKIEKDLKYLQPFKGNGRKLLAFIDAIDRLLTDYLEQQQLVFRIVYDLKILGTVKNLLTLSQPGNWETCKIKLKQHFRPSKDQRSE